MPNWVEVYFSATGSAEDIERFVHENMGYPATFREDWGEGGKEPNFTEKYLCFNALMPVPKEVREYGYNPKDGDARGKDGYTWCMDNWGCKWDIYSSTIDLPSLGWSKGATEISAYFLTPWSPPWGWIEQLNKTYPDIRFVFVNLPDE